MANTNDAFAAVAEFARDELATCRSRIAALEAELAALRRSPDASGEYARGLRDAAQVALAIELKTGDPKCVRGHDRCESGADEDCPYCERKTPVADAILALPQSAGAETGDDEQLLTIIARSIGRTTGTGNYQQRAQDVLDSIRSANVRVPQPSKIVPSAIPEAARVERGDDIRPEKILDHKWLDPECIQNGCQSLIWKGRYESAVKGRADFRQAMKEARERIDAAVRAERVACEKVARHTAENCKSSTGYAIALGIADAIRARATTGEKEGSVSEK